LIVLLHVEYERDIELPAVALARPEAGQFIELLSLPAIAMTSDTRLALCSGRSAARLRDDRIEPGPVVPVGPLSVRPVRRSPSCQIVTRATGHAGAERDQRNDRHRHPRDP
jgi:hypothetical protein